MDEWREIPDFPGYAVNDKGEVASHKTGHVLSLNYNQYGIASAGMYVEGKLHRKSVALLVAENFLSPPKRDTFDTPTHLDGDRRNCRADNLIWRPRWFAIKYHQQFEKVHASFLDMPVEIVDSGVVFERTIDLCMKYGVLATDVVHAVHNKDHVVPFGWFEVKSPDNAHDIMSRRKRSI